MKRDRDEKRRKESERKMFFENVSEPSNPPDELAQNVSKKSPSDELFIGGDCTHNRMEAVQRKGVRGRIF